MPFFFRINKVKIIDNKESGFLFFIKDRAELKFNSMIVTGDSKFPQIEPFRKSLNEKTRDPSADQAFATSIVNQIISQRSLITIDSIRDNQTITFGDTGYVLHQSFNMPQDLHWCLLAIEDDQAIRDFGQTVQTVVGSTGFADFTKSLATLIGSIPDPSFAVGMAAIRFISGIVATSLKNNKNDMAGLLYMSLNQYEHYPHGERSSKKVPDLTGNMLVDYSLFGFNNEPPRHFPKRLP